MKTRNTGGQQQPQRHSRKSSKANGILKHSNTLQQSNLKDNFEESQTPHFANRLVIPSNIKRTSAKNSRQNSRKHSRQSSKIQFEPSVSLEADRLMAGPQARPTRQRPSTKSNVDLQSVYQEDAANRKVFNRSALRNNTQAISMNSSQVPGGGATTIFKSIFFQKPSNVSDYLTCESTDEDYVRSQLDRQPHSFTRPEVLQYSQLSDNVFYKQQ